MEFRRWHHRQRGSRSAQLRSSRQLHCNTDDHRQLRRYRHDNSDHPDCSGTKRATHTHADGNAHRDTFAHIHTGRSGHADAHAPANCNTNTAADAHAPANCNTNTPADIYAKTSTDANFHIGATTQAQAASGEGNVQPHTGANICVSRDKKSRFTFIKCHTRQA
jgi:hypothetical protein